MRVVWTDTALRHLATTHEYIAHDSPHYAARLVDRLLARSEQLEQFPQSGRRVPEYDDRHIRQLVEPPYRIIYRVRPDRIDVLAVVHGAERSLDPDDPRVK